MAAVSENQNMVSASAEILKHALNGVEKYHASPVMPFKRKMKTVAEINGSRILTADNWDSENVVLLIPSLINGWSIYDIEEDFSFAAYLYMHGLTPFIVDWAIPDQSDISLDDYILHHLKPLIDKILEEGYEVKSLVGYCMGGTIIAALLSAYPELMGKTGKQILIAPPWDFSYQTIEQSVRLQTMAMQSFAMSSPVPIDFVQSLFWAIDPLQIIKKFRYFPNVNNPDRFVRVEDWLNEGRAVSLFVIQTCLFDWYRDNKISKGEWILNGRKVSADMFGPNALIAVGAKDNLVPVQSINPLLDQNPHVKTVTVDTGHIGLMASDKSKDGLWKPIVDFLK